MLQQLSVFSFCPTIQFLIHPPPFPNIISKATLGTLPFTLQHMFHLRSPCRAIGHLALPTQPLPREAEDFPSGGKYPKHVLLPTNLADVLAKGISY